MSDDKAGDISEKDQGIPAEPQPHEEDAKGTPTNDRLQSEVPQRGNKDE